MNVFRMPNSVIAAMHFLKQDGEEIKIENLPKTVVSPGGKIHTKH